MIKLRFLSFTREFCDMMLKWINIAKNYYSALTYRSMGKEFFKARIIGKTRRHFYRWCPPLEAQRQQHFCHDSLNIGNG